MSLKCAGSKYEEGGLLAEILLTFLEWRRQVLVTWTCFKVLLPLWDRDCGGIDILAGAEYVPDPKSHMPNWFPFEKDILLGSAELVPV